MKLLLESKRFIYLKHNGANYFHKMIFKPEIKAVETKVDAKTSENSNIDKKKKYKKKKK